ncbi:MAG: uroporphyrinogen decarboxylase [Firmicutes bacterium]|nr:uroporphyrinogen decarboxylase [Bacillota bacterium]
MTKRERVEAALNGKEVDRVPHSIWLHFPHKDQDPRSLAEHQVGFMKKYDHDFIKLMPFGLYGVQDYGAKVKIFGTKTEPPIIDQYGIKDIKEWERVGVFNGTYGTLGKQVQLSQHVSRLLQKEKDDIPFVQTIFSPLTTAEKLAGPRLYEDLKQYPNIIHQALQNITETTINFIKENINAGVSGFFFATKCSTLDLMTKEEYTEFGTKYDLQLFESYKSETFFNIIHIHGENTMFEELAAYPGNCISWHDRWVAPDMGEARKITDKCLLGGLNERDTLVNGTPEDIDTHVMEAIEMAGRKSLMIGPGCVAKPETPEINYFAARVAVEKYGRYKSKT